MIVFNVMVDLLVICFCVILVCVVGIKKNVNICYLIVYIKFNYWFNIRIFINSFV